MDDLTTDQKNLAIEFAENRVDNEMGSAGGDDKEEAATYLAAHVAKMMMRTASSVVQDGSIRVEELKEGDTMYKSMYERVVDEHGGVMFGRVGANNG